MACDDGCLRVFRIEDGQNGLIYDYSLPPLPYRLLSVAWHPNGKILYSGTSEASLHAWDTGARRELFRIHTGKSLLFPVEALTSQKRKESRC